MKAFGIGSLWFGGKHGNNDERTPAEHVAAIRRALEAIPNVRDVKIVEPTRYSSTIVDLGTDGSTPLYPNLSISFGLYLPTRIQDQLISIRKSHAETENFEVVIRHGYDAAIAFISYDVNEPPRSPSDGIIVVRKYLEQQFAQSKEDVTFVTLGPSPFHADFILQEAANALPNGFDFLDLSRAGVGYKDYLVEYCPEQFRSQDDAWTAFMKEIQEQLEQFYTAILYRNEMLHHAVEAENLLDQLLELQTQRGIKSVIARFRLAPLVTRDLMVSLLQGEKERMGATRFIEKCRRDNLLPDGSPFTSAILHAIADHSDQLPVSQIGEVVKLFEERHLKRVANLAVLFAGLVGGTLGAAITALAK